MSTRGHSAVINPMMLGGSGERGPAVDYHRAIESYYRAYQERERDALESLLTPNFHFVSSFGEYRERDAMLDEIWPGVGQAWATDLRVFGVGPEFVVLYEQETAPGVDRARMRVAEYVRFEGERIAELEVFMGRPSEGGAPPDASDAATWQRQGGRVHG